LKILITGYSRSGTTLVRKLVAAHHHVAGILHETMILVANRGVIGKTMYGWQGGEPITLSSVGNLQDINWGEKILYDYPCIDGGVVDALDYCLFWNECFQDESKIVNVLRYPFDVVLSSMKKRKSSIEKALGIYKHWMPWMAQEVNSLGNSVTIKFEDLLYEPLSTLEKVFDHCHLDSSKGAVTGAISGSTKDIAFNRIKRSVAYRHNESYGSLNGSGLEEIAMKLGYEIWK
jgi:hypothetical protein